MLVYPEHIKDFLRRTWGIDLRELAVHRLEVPIPGLPRSLNGLRIAHLSDLHCGPVMPRSHLERVVAAVQAESPDLVALTGDFVDGVQYAAECADLLSPLRPPLGSFACMGNHDHFHANEVIPASFQSVGIRLLRNEHCLISVDGARLCVIGLDDVGNYGVGVRRVAPSDDLPRALAGSPLFDTVRLLLVHNPDFVTKPVFIRETARRPIHLTLAGHTHGGQVWLPFFGAPYVASRCGQRFAGGLVEWMGTQIHISRGAGSSLRLRFNCPYEASILILRPA